LSKERTIGQLRRKLALLVDYDHYADLTAIAKAIGTKLKTMESWADTGTDKATPGLIPAKHYPSVVRVFQKAIEQSHAGIDAKTILHGTVGDVEQWLKPLPSTGLLELFARNADFSSGKLFVEKSKPIGAVARRSELSPTTARAVTTSDWFRIEFPSVLKSKNVIAMQRCRRLWSACPIQLVSNSSEIMIPGLDQYRQPDWMQEREWLGTNQFFVLELRNAWPAMMQRAFDEGAPISAELLNRIAETYEAQNSQSRAASAIEIDIKQAEPN
jgi:hypothetical protein